jgi:uncharacterized protein
LRLLGGKAQVKHFTESHRSPGKAKNNFEGSIFEMKSKLFYIVSMVLIAAMLGACAGNAAAQVQTPTVTATSSPPTSGQPANPRTLTVSGTGVAYLTPDIAYVSIGVHTENTDAATAVSANNTNSQKVIDALKNYGIADKDIQTTNFSIYPQQQVDNQGKPTGQINYVVDNTVYVTVRDLSKIGNLLDTVVKAGANSINSIQFDVTDRTKALSDARQAAIADAKAQAQEVASAAGVTLGAVQSIDVTGGSTPPVPVFQAKGAGPMVASAANVPVNPGQLTVTISVNVVYQIQ